MLSRRNIIEKKAFNVQKPLYKTCDSITGNHHAPLITVLVRKNPQAINIKKLLS